MIAVIDCTQGPLIDGRPYGDPLFVQQLENYHAGAATAHRTHSKVTLTMPVPSLHGASAGTVAQGVTATLEPPGWIGGTASHRRWAMAD